MDLPMCKNIFISLAMLLSLAFSANAQNASDYFPSAPGFKWFYKTVPYDSLNSPIDSLSFVTVDSFAVSQTYVDKPANIIISKHGPKESFLNKSYTDTNYVSLESTNIWKYMSSFPGTDTLTIGLFNTFNGWFSAYRLSQPVNSSYTIYTKDTVVNYNGFNTTLTHMVNAKRLTDQNTPTDIGSFLCKKFILTFSIRAKISILSFTVLTIMDTVYIAPGNYIVSEIRPSANVDLSFFGQTAFFIAGNKMDIQAPPSVQSVNHDNESPVQYNLFQNYPNPFNPSTLIKYLLPYESNVKIIVYNSIGQVIKELVSEVQQSGLHEQTFFSSSLASGVYFYAIHANSIDGKQNYSNTKKMILLK
jgi:hypothetical protein